MSDQTRAIVQSDSAPAPIGPYSQAVKAGGFVFVSGQLGLDLKTGDLVGPDVAAQTRQILKSLEAILTQSGSSMARVVKTTIFLTNLGDFATVNKIYGEAFIFEPPARSTIQVAALPKGAAVEIEVIAQVAPSSGGMM